MRLPARLRRTVSSPMKKAPAIVDDRGGFVAVARFWDRGAYRPTPFAISRLMEPSSFHSHGMSTVLPLS